MKHKNWQCCKCQAKDFEEGQFAATGGNFTRFFNIQNKSFSTLTCLRCKYTEIYKTETGNLGNVLDFFGN